ncbi:hypothetical protein [Sphingobacterium rhinopitheci]|uniref:hypothetical protein n=1 Tax=Sphingobacterium rhinopitheci TaxID=2781960 RepID=UPI001F51984E|nr:hypothetical protein [Sphingobacterium rhinopitheci]MCI0920557.1 hypothetical protein [Sphingobacterium rhinopitheci]
MKVKKYMKWVFPFFIPIIILLIGKYNTDILIGISSCFLFLGFILMFNPTWIIKPSASELQLFKKNLKQKFEGYENDIDEIQRQLLRDFRISYVSHAVLGCIFLGFIYYCILLSIDSKFSYGSIIGLTILFLLFFLFESNSLLRSLFSRKERFITSYYCNLLKNKNFVDSLTLTNSDRKNGSTNFDEYWLNKNINIHDLIMSINQISKSFEKENEKWVLCDGHKSSSNQLNLAGFISALINKGYISKTITISKETAIVLKEIFYIPEQKSGKELQKLYGKGFKEFDVEYTKYFEEILLEL